MADVKRLTAFVFTGGGSLGAVQVGMLRSLIEAGARPDFIVGASVGALNGAYFAGAPSSEGVERLAGIWRGVKAARVFPVTLVTALGLLRHPENLISPAPLRYLIESHLAFSSLEAAPVPLHIEATDLQGLPVVLSSGPAVEAILASAAIPGVFPMVEVNGASLMDGAIASSSVVRIAMELGASKIIVLQSGYACALSRPPDNAVANALHAITLLISWRLIHDLETLPSDVDLHITPALCPLDVSPFDFSHADELIERAARSTGKWIREGGLTRRSRPEELRPHHH